jgi:imidazolonepropionase-like amidohydrolase
LVVSPGFIDLHQHGQDDENYRFKAMDGVPLLSNSKSARATLMPGTRNAIRSL